MRTWLWPRQFAALSAFAAGIHESGNIPFVFTTMTYDENGEYGRDGETTFPPIALDWPGEDAHDGRGYKEHAFVAGADEMAAGEDPALTYEQVGQDIYIGNLKPDRIVPEDADSFFVSPAFNPNGPNFLDILSE